MAREASSTLSKQDLESLINCIFNTADGAGATKEEMREALDLIADLADPDTTVEQVGDTDEWQVIEDAEDADPDADDND
jgi:hypothetical protein